MIDIDTKSKASKIKWLTEVTTKPELGDHLTAITTLIHQQPAGLEGIDLLFTTNYFAKKKMKIPSEYYREAILAMTTLEVKKKTDNPRQEKIFFNETFLANGETLIPNETSHRNRIYTYGQLLDEVEKRQNQEHYHRGITSIYDTITHKDLLNRHEHTINTTYHGQIPFKIITEKII